MKTVKRTVSFSINESLVDEFNVLTSVKKIAMSEVVESLIRDYIVINKAELNEYMLKFWNNEIE